MQQHIGLTLKNNIGENTRSYKQNYINISTTELIEQANIKQTNTEKVNMGIQQHLEKVANVATQLANQHWKYDIKNVMIGM